MDDARVGPSGQQLPLPIDTPRLVLRRFHEGDVAAFAAYRSDLDVARYQSWSAPVSLPVALDLVRGLAALDPQSPGWFQYAVELKSDGLLIGDVGVNMHENRMQAEIGYTLARGHQRRGLATEAVGRVLHFLFTDQGLHRVSAECDARNTRSANLLRRLGFRQEGLRSAATWIKGEWTDDLLFGLLAAEWKASRGCR